MADQAAHAESSGDSHDAEASSGARSRLVPKLIAAAVVFVILGVECLVVYLYLPSSGETRAMAESDIRPAVASHSVEDEKDHGTDEAAEHGEEGEERKEVDLGEYSVTAYEPSSSITLRIDFHLWGTVSAPEAAEFEHLFEEKRNRIREQVLVTIRSADVSEFTDAGLGLIKRTILEKSNETLGKPLLLGVIFSDFSYIEQ